MEVDPTWKEEKQTAKPEPLFKGEKQIMELFWKENRPLTSLDVAELTGYSMSTGHLHRVLQRLEEMGYIGMCGAERAPKHLIRKFAPLISREGYASVIAMSGGFSAPVLAEMGLALVQKYGKDQPEEERKQLIEEFQALIDAYKKEEEEE